MRLVPIMAALALCVPGVALAQQAVPFTPEATETCLSNAQGASAKRDCIGASAQACRKAMKDPANTDIAACMGAEAEYWTLRMNTAYDQMMEKAKLADEKFAQNAKSKAIPFKLTEDLELMQTAWADWREKRCSVEAMMRRGTPYTMTAASNCTMKLIGEQAQFLESAVAY
ncbi:lysozyme inhibitor LprI family protein [Phaeovulum veldkampii]|nr:lysozyme inhibitor LprI family protein [Phaeovulum veldkampii]TDQ59179.1 uncharacterized protein YecT (DUF1311 family) [Phaeovulum veldkampii DSM 11550]